MKNHRKALIASCMVLIAASVYVWNSGKDARPATGKPGLVEYGGISVRYYEQGAGDTVVLIPSLGRCASDFNELAGALAGSGYRTVSVELRGTGGTTGSSLFARLTQHDYARDVASVIRNLTGGGKAHVVGHAFGNRVARTLATDHPGLVRSLVLVAAGDRVDIPTDVRRAVLGCFLNFLPDCVREKSVRTAFFAQGSDIPVHWLHGWYFRAAWPQSRAAQATPEEEWRAGGQAPILVLQAENDVIAPPELSAALKRELGGRVTVVSIPRAGHAMLPEQPGLIRDAVISFLRAH
jgi:pimeloyl-ACP methyl ester carboxylesterase